MSIQYRERLSHTEIRAAQSPMVDREGDETRRSRDVIFVVCAATINVA
jgi:hypothetical protein